MHFSFIDLFAYPFMYLFFYLYFYYYYLSVLRTTAQHGHYFIIKCLSVR